MACRHVETDEAMRRERGAGDAHGKDQPGEGAAFHEAMPHPEYDRIGFGCVEERGSASGVVLHGRLQCFLLVW